MDNRNESAQMAVYWEAQDLYDICAKQVRNANKFLQKFGEDCPGAIEMITMKIAAIQDMNLAVDKQVELISDADYEETIKEIGYVKKS